MYIKNVFYLQIKKSIILKKESISSVSALTTTGAPRDPGRHDGSHKGRSRKGRDDRRAGRHACWPPDDTFYGEVTYTVRTFLYCVRS